MVNDTDNNTSRIKKVVGFYNEKYKKDGSIMIWGLFIIMMMFTFSALFLSYVNMAEIYEKTDGIVDIVGKTRVQAVDIPLKEEYGIIEVIHLESDYDDLPNYVDSEGSDITSEHRNEEYYNNSIRSTDATPGYDQAILPKNDINYIEAANRANRDAIHTGLVSLENRFKNFNKEGNSFIKADEKNFCIKVFPLPKGSTVENIKLSCDVIVTKDNGEEQVVTVKSTERVNGIEHNLNYNSSAEIENKELRVYNAVFVGFAYVDENALFYKYFENLFGLEPEIRTVSRIVYPQIDAISFGEGWD